MALANFDTFFLNLPPFDRRDDFDGFWEQAMAEVKRVPLEPVLNPGPRRSSSRFTAIEVEFKGFTKARVMGHLLVPRGRAKPGVIIYIHDYNQAPAQPQQFLDDSCAYFFLTLRGHDSLPRPAEGETHSPGYLIESLLDRDTYYVKAVYLDALRAIDMLRLVNEINCSRVGIAGKGLGAAAALFAASQSPRVAGLVIDSPSFCSLPVSQNLSTGDTAREINDFIASHRNRARQVKENLTYFDTVNFSDRITCPVLAVVGLRDTIASPSCVFGLFNHLLCEKTIEVYPDEGNTAGGDRQLQKSMTWLAGLVNQTLS